MKDGKPTSQLLESEYFKYVADVMLQEAGIELVLHCTAVDAVMAGQTIRGVITESKSGRQAILAKRVIDATGDADVASLAGAPFKKAAKPDLMECTANIEATNVDVDEYYKYQMEKGGTIKERADKTSGKEDDMPSTHIRRPFDQARQAGELKVPRGSMCWAIPATTPRRARSRPLGQWPEQSHHVPDRCARSMGKAGTRDGEVVGIAVPSGVWQKSTS